MLTDTIPHLLTPVQLFVSPISSLYSSNWIFYFSFHIPIQSAFWSPSFAPSKLPCILTFSTECALYLWVLSEPWVSSRGFSSPIPQTWGLGGEIGILSANAAFILERKFHSFKTHGLQLSHPRPFHISLTSWSLLLFHWPFGYLDDSFHLFSKSCRILGDNGQSYGQLQNTLVSPVSWLFQVQWFPPSLCSEVTSLTLSPLRTASLLQSKLCWPPWGDNEMAQEVELHWTRSNLSLPKLCPRAEVLTF